VFFECREDFGIVEESQSGYYMDKGLRSFSGPQSIKPMPQSLLKTYKVFVDPVSAVAGFAGSTDSIFYPTHISISDERNPKTTYILKINRKTLAFEVIIERTDSFTSSGYYLRRYSHYSSNTTGKCNPVPMDPANKI
jgi:hypothetical protein